MSAQRCSFCGVTESFVHRRRPLAWQDVGGRPVCDGECAEKEATRQAAQPAPLEHAEVDGWWGLRGGVEYVGPFESRERLQDVIAW
ncbi:hypothetical protein WMF30_10760 [Sorangium sp. So ce134]